MRLTKLISLALIAVAAFFGGFLVAAVIAGATVVAWVARRLFFKSTALHPADTSWPARPSSGSSSDVIDVAATEIHGVDDDTRLRSGS